MIKIKVNGKNLEIDERISYYEISKSFEKDGKIPYLVKINRDVKELRRKTKDGENIEFLYYDSSIVKLAYARTAILIMLKAIHDVYPDADAALKFKVQDSYYFDIKGVKIDEKMALHIIDAYDKVVKS